MKQWTFRDIPIQSGRTFLVTGAAGGLGFVTALKLASRGARVIMTARDPARGAVARGRIRSLVRRADVELRLLDLADLSSVKSFAAQLEVEGQPIDVLVNCAAIMMPPRSFTRQGIELQFGVNHLAHFALTLLLLGRLKAGRDARVVTASCNAYRRGRIDFDFAAEGRYERRDCYAQSKLANALFALELDRRLRVADLPIKSVAALPVYSATNLHRSGPTGLLYLALLVGNRWLAQSAEQGALSLLYAATSPAVEGGQFIGFDESHPGGAYPAIVKPARVARDVALAQRLWIHSERLAGTGSSPVLDPQTEDVHAVHATHSGGRGGTRRLRNDAEPRSAGVLQSHRLLVQRECR